MATTNFMTNCGLAEKKDKDPVYKYLGFLKDLPIEKLNAAKTLEELQAAFEALFKHMKKIREYPINRAVKLMHVVSRDAVIVLRRILVALNPMAKEFEDFILSTKTTVPMFDVWEEGIKKFTSDIKKLKKSKSDTSTISNLDHYPVFDQFKDRIREIQKIRKEDYELREVVKLTLATDPVVREQSLKYIRDAFEYLRETDIIGGSDEDYNVAMDNYKKKLIELKENCKRKSKSCWMPQRTMHLRCFESVLNSTLCFVVPKSKKPFENIRTN